MESSLMTPEGTSNDLGIALVIFSENDGSGCPSSPPKCIGHLGSMKPFSGGVWILRVYRFQVMMFFFFNVPIILTK